MIRTKRKSRRKLVAVTVGLSVAAVVVVLLRSTDWLASLGGRVKGDRLERARESPQYGESKFRNPQPTKMATGSFVEMARRQFLGGEQREPLGTIPVVARTASDYTAPPASGLRATWIGWSSVLVEIEGHTVLTDPIWSERCSPSTLIGPKRFHPPPMPLSELPMIDAVVISHDHYDHLDMPAIRALAARGTHFVVPLGIGAHLDAWDVPAAQIHELDWNESFDLDGLEITATPARHYSGRNPIYKDETLWASWVVKGAKHRVFFSGDSGYSDVFRAIGAEHGPFDLTLIKIGASDPTWSEIHMTPEQAIQTHHDVRGRVLLPVHWATFNLGFHAWREPVDRAVAAAEMSDATIVVPRPGELVEPGAVSPEVEPWWVGAAEDAGK